MAGINRDDVFQAADELLKAGERPTIERIRTHLGRGSPNTITGYLNEWFAGLGARLAAPDQEAEASQAVNRLLRRLWQMALEEANAHAASHHQARAAELAQREQALAQDRDDLDRERERLRQRTLDLENAAQLARTQLEATERRLAGAEEQLRRQQAANESLQAALAEAGQANRQLRDEAQAASRRYEASLAAIEERHRTHERRWMNELDAERTAAKQLRGELNDARKAALKAAKEHSEQLAALTDRLKRADKDAGETASRLERVQADLARAEAARARGETALNAATAQLASLQADLARAQADNAALSAAAAERERYQQELFEQVRIKDSQITQLLAAQGSRAASPPERPAKR